MKSLSSILSWFFKPKYEVNKENYYSLHLRKDDSKELQEFIPLFTKQLKIPSTILAVGSSTFPLYYWKDQKKKNLKIAIKVFPESYDDIDLLLLPNNQFVLKDYKNHVIKALASMKYQFESKDLTIMGRSYHKHLDGSYAPFAHFSYGKHSLTTHLKNNTSLDLIIGSDEILPPASEKISLERKSNCAFSLLYP